MMLPVRLAVRRAEARRRLSRAKRAALPAELSDRLPKLGDVCDDPAALAEVNLEQTAIRLDLLETALAALDDHRSQGGPVRPALPPDVSLEALPSHNPSLHRYQGHDGWTQSSAPDEARWESPGAWLRHRIHEVDPDALGFVDRYETDREERDMVQQLTGKQGWRRHGHHRVIRFRFRKAPVELDLWEESEAHALWTTALQPEAPDLFLRPQTWRDGLAKLFGRRDAEVGDQAFDDAFLIDADDDDAAAALSRPTRKLLTTIAGCDEPKLLLQDGLARLSFHTTGTADSTDAAIELLRRLHRKKWS